MHSKPTGSGPLSGWRWRQSAFRALNQWLRQFHEEGRRRLDGWAPPDTDEPLDVVVAEPTGVHVWVMPKRLEVLDDYRLDGVVDTASVVVPEGSLSAVRQVLPSTYGVLTVGTVAGTPTLLEIRRPSLLKASNAAALGELLSRDELAAGLLRMGRHVSPFSIRSELLAELLDLLPPERAREWILLTLLHD
jgi:hypothetical protein